MIQISFSLVLGLLCFLLARCDDDRPPGQYHHLFNSTHEKPWMVLDKIDGLKNEDVVLLISGSAAGGFRYVRERIISSQRTWMKFFANAFVIVEDTFQSRFAFRHCKIRETPHFTSFHCHNEPTWVLSRKCLATKGGGPGPCCKVDELFTYLMIDRPDVYSHTKFAIHGDDDNFIRVDQMMMFMAALSNVGLSTVPIVGSNQLGEFRENVYGTKGCQEIHTYGWYQPLLINRAAMELMKVAFSSYGVWETCDNFHVTHDVGLGPFLWLFGVYHIRVPGWEVSNHDIHMGTIVTHKVVHDSKMDKCDNITNFSESQRYNQKILMGCGDVNELQANHKGGHKDFEGRTMYNDNYELWAWFKEHSQDAQWGFHNHVTWQNYNVTAYANGSSVLSPGSIPGEENTFRIKHVLNMTVDEIAADGTFKGDKVFLMNLPVLSPMSGYDGTPHAKANNLVKKWVGFKTSDCAPIPETPKEGK